MKQKQHRQTSLPKLQTSEFILDTALFAPFQKVASHSHENAFFCMALRGACAESYGRKIRIYEPSVLSFLPAGQTHSLEFCQQGMRSFSIEIKQPLIKRMREYSSPIEESVYCRTGRLTQLFNRVYSEFCRADDVSPLAVEGLVLEMLAEVSRHRTSGAKQPPQWLRGATEFVHDRFSESLSLSEIANAAGVHPAYLSRVFRRFYRCSIGDYIRCLRVEYALQHIPATKTPLLEIALAAGFSDQSHFSRIFKRQTGITPSQYRAICSRS